MSIETMKQAIEALQFALHVGFDESSESQIKKGDKAGQQHRKAITSLRQAIAEAEKQELVGVVCINCGSSWSDERLAKEKEKDANLISCCPEREMVNIYTHPQPKREPLTDEQIVELNFDGEFCTLCDDDEAILDFARAIEAAHGIKE